MLAQELSGGLVVMTAFTKMQGAADSAAFFEQEANFWWLSGINAPDWWLIVDSGSVKSWLVSPEMSESQQLFDGSLTPGQAKRISGVDEVIGRSEATELLRRFAERNASVYTLGELPYAQSAAFALNPAPKRMRSLLKRTFTSVYDCQKELVRLRAIKQTAEMEAMTRAARLTVEGFQTAKDKLASCQHEYEIEAELTYCFRRRGAVHAFEPIVARGKNACTLHYADNADELRPGQLLLIDAGARIDGYPADVTRTFAIGDMASRQIAVHKAVQTAEQRIVELLKPGLDLKEYIELVDDIMKDALLSLGLMKTYGDKTRYRRYFPHAVSHGLGLDVHESLGGYKEFLPGMVVTVEPGIYIPEEEIGVRIEDDIVITENGTKNMTAGLSTDL